MDYELLRQIMEAFSKENTRLKGEITRLEREISSLKTKNDDKILAEVFRDVPAPNPAPVKKVVKVAQKKVKETQPEKTEEEKLLDLQVADMACLELAKKAGPASEAKTEVEKKDRKEYMKQYQEAYRQKKKAEKALKASKPTYDA